MVVGAQEPRTAACTIAFVNERRNSTSTLPLLGTTARQHRLPATLHQRLVSGRAFRIALESVCRTGRIEMLVSTRDVTQSVICLWVAKQLLMPTVIAVARGVFFNGTIVCDLVYDKEVGFAVSNLGRSGTQRRLGVLRLRSALGLFCL